MQERRAQHPQRVYIVAARRGQTASLDCCRHHSFGCKSPFDHSRSFSLFCSGRKSGITGEHPPPITGEHHPLPVTRYLDHSLDSNSIRYCSRSFKATFLLSFASAVPYCIIYISPFLQAVAHTPTLDEFSRSGLVLQCALLLRHPDSGLRYVLLAWLG